MNMIQVPVGSTFGHTDIDSSITVTAYDQTGPFVPKKKDPYIVPRGLLSNILTYWKEPYHGGMLLIGPTGCGKTSAPRQVAACLNIPVQKATGHSRLELQDILGHYVIIDGDCVWQDGPLTIAAAEGHWFILDELDRMDPAHAVALHEVLDADALTLAEAGGRIVPIHPNFRFFATANTTGMGDDAQAIYQSAQMQDAALLDRFTAVQATYLDAATEKQLVRATAPNLSDRIIDGMLKIAQALRDRFLSDGPDSLPVTMSTRTVLTWARLIMAYAGASKNVNVFSYTLDLALTNRTPPYVQKAIREIAQTLASDLT